jgi:hypothetical protein
MSRADEILAAQLEVIQHDLAGAEASFDETNSRKVGRRSRRTKKCEPSLEA